MKISVQDANGNRFTAIYSGGRPIRTADLDGHVPLEGLGRWKLEDGTNLMRRGKDNNGAKKFETETGLALTEVL